MKKNIEKVCGFRKMCYLCNRNRERCFLEIRNLAEIAQLVEHNLAKVGVAGPSPVFRSHSDKGQVKQIVSYAQVAELVDAYVSGAYVARRAGSSPVLGTS